MKFLVAFVVCLAAANAAVISSSILANFKKEFNDILAKKPANPNFDVYENLLDQKVNLAKMTIDATAGVSALDKLKAKADIEFHKDLIEDQFDLWEDAEDKKTVLVGKYGATVKDFISQAMAAKTNVELLTKYQAALNKLRMMTPLATATFLEREAWDDAEDVLENEYEAAQMKLGF